MGGQFDPPVCPVLRPRSSLWQRFYPRLELPLCAIGAVDISHKPESVSPICLIPSPEKILLLLFALRFCGKKTSEQFFGLVCQYPADLAERESLGKLFPLLRLLA